MKIIIAGSREIFDYELLKKFMKKICDQYEITQVISGNAKGMDKCGEYWAVEHGIPIVDMPADWDKHGKAAGPIRNAEMLKISDLILVIKKTESRGSSHMASIAKASGKPTFVYNVDTKKGNKYNV